MIILALFFCFGLICASFMGLVVSRLYTGATIVRGRSACDACGVTLSPLALVPIFSWVMSRGRCIECGTYVGVSSTVGELLLGALFVCGYLTYGFTVALVLLLIALTLLTGLVLYDSAHSILPPVLLWSFIASAVLFAMNISPNLDIFALTLFLALLLGSCMALFHLVSGGRAMGFADAPLTFGLSLLVGYPLALSGLIFSFWIGGVVGAVLLARRALGATISSEIPFAPFLAAGYLLALFTEWSAFLALDIFLNAVGM